MSQIESINSLPTEVATKVALEAAGAKIPGNRNDLSLPTVNNRATAGAGAVSSNSGGIDVQRRIIRTVFSNPLNERYLNTTSRTFYNRAHLPDIKTAEDFNTYLHFGIFPAFADTTPADYNKEKNYERKEESLYAGTPGVRSLFNRAGAILIGADNKFKYKDIDITNAHQWRLGLNVPLMDSPENRRLIKQETGCSVKELVSASQKGLMGKETYAYSDFMFCKHLGTVSNNYMVTLRRFPIPVDDYIGTTGIFENTRRDTYFNSKNPVSIGCMVTWIGVSGNDMSNILKYSYSMPFKEQEAELQDKKLDADKSQTLLNGMFSMFDSQYREEYMQGYSGTAAEVIFNKFGLPVGPPPYTGENAPGNFKDRNKVYGPVDAVKSTYIRSDQGLKFDQQITLVFEYELRSYNGVNGRQAMLDLISNILNVTYTTGSFWGGGIRGFGASQSNVFNNLNIFKCKGGFTEFIDAFSEDISGLTQRDSDFKKNYDAESGKSLIKNALKTLNQLGGMLMAGMLNRLGRPQKVMYNSLLSPAPVGFWHLTIGNPRKPIMSIGNMVITGCTLEHQGPLGLDDFPTGLKVTVNLSRGKPRDIRDIEKLYMAGNDRIYSPMDTKVFDMYNNGLQYNLFRKNNTLDKYNPQSNVHIIDYELKKIGNEEVRVGFTAEDLKDDPATGKKAKQITLGLSDKDIHYNDKDFMELLNKSIMKYFGTNDVRAIYTAATEQEWGSNIPGDNGVLTEEQYQEKLNKHRQAINRKKFKDELDKVIKNYRVNMQNAAKYGLTEHEIKNARMWANIDFNRVQDKYRNIIDSDYFKEATTSAFTDINLNDAWALSQVPGYNLDSRFRPSQDANEQITQNKGAETSPSKHILSEAYEDLDRDTYNQTMLAMKF